MNSKSIGEPGDQAKSSRFILKEIELSGQSRSRKAVCYDRALKKQVFIKTASQKEHKSQLEFYRHSKKYPELGVVVPEPFAYLYFQNSPSILMEYFPNAENLKDCDLKSKTKYYMQVLKFLDKAEALSINNQISSSLQYLFLPYVLFRNIVCYPRHAKLFFALFVKLVSRFNPWLSLKSDTFCHGDINVANILRHRGKVVLIDFARSCVSHKFYNFSQALNSSWRDSDFFDSLLLSLKKERNLSGDDLKAILSFAAYNLMQRLTASYSNAAQARCYLDRIRKLLPLL